MSVSVHGAGAVPFARSAHNAAKSSRAAASNPFKRHVSAAVSDLSAAPASSGTSAPAPAPDWRQLFGGAVASGASPAPASSASASIVPNSKQAAVSAGDPVSTNPVDTLTAALQRAGISTGSMSIVAHDDNVSYPGGTGWVNHLITVTAGGRSENIDVGLMNINPDVAAMDIKRMLS